MHDRSGYEAEIFAFLDNFEMTLPSGEIVPGRDILKRAPSWDTPVEIKDGADASRLPESWLGIVAHLGEILGKGELGLNPYQGQIEIIDSEQMLDAYSSAGLPNAFPTWRQGQTREAYERAYQGGERGLAYEIVINSMPSIAYCMEQNSKTMMILVILHACQGHSHFFRNNHLFTQFTQAGTILSDQRIRQDFVRECREKHGDDAVELIIDACEALSAQGVYRYTKPPARTPQEEEARRRAIFRQMDASYDHLMETTLPGKRLKSPFKAAAEPGDDPQYDKDENILRFIATYSPRLKEWERRLINHICDINQYFYPNRQTKIMNEGCATFVHYRLMERLYDLSLINDAMWLEFIRSHTNVITQPGWDDPRYQGELNPYALGFAMCNDIVRVCENPTAEDRQRFRTMRDYPGNPDWRAVWRDAMVGYRDESFIEQFLSPKVIRDFRLFSIRDNSAEKTMVVEAVHGETGYDRIRRDLAAQQTLSNNVPNIEVDFWNFKGDRTLILRHAIHQGQTLAPEETRQSLEHLYALWKYPVILESVDPDGKIVETFEHPKGSKRPAPAPTAP